MGKPRATGPGSAEPSPPRTADPGAVPRGQSLSDFDYDLPSTQIAQHPLPDRSASRLLVLDRATGATQHRHFRDLPQLIPPGDLVVINTSRVIPARLHGKRETGNAAELLMVRAMP